MEEQRRVLKEHGPELSMEVLSGMDVLHGNIQVSMSPWPKQRIGRSHAVVLIEFAYAGWCAMPAL